MKRFPKCQVACYINSRTIQPMEEINGLALWYTFQSSYQKTNIALNGALFSPDRFVTEARAHFLSESCMFFIARVAEYSISSIRKWDEMFLVLACFPVGAINIFPCAFMDIRQFVGSDANDLLNLVRKRARVYIGWEQHLPGRTFRAIR